MSLLRNPVNPVHFYGMYTIRTATPHDIPELVALINRAYRGEPSRQGWTTEADFLTGDIRTDTEDLTGMMARPGAVFLKACDTPATIFGCVFLEKRGERLYLGMLSVAPELQGKGIGKLLLHGAETLARQLGCRSIFMQVISLRHELISWYRRHGYEDTGERKPFDAPLKFGVPAQSLEFMILEKPV